MRMWDVSMEEMAKDLLSSLYGLNLMRDKKEAFEILKEGLEKAWVIGRDGSSRGLNCVHNWYGPLVDSVSRYYKCSKCDVKDRVEGLCTELKGCNVEHREAHNCPFEVEVNSNEDFICTCCDKGIDICKGDILF